MGLQHVMLFSLFIAHVVCDWGLDPLKVSVTITNIRAGREYGLIELHCSGGLPDYFVMYHGVFSSCDGWYMHAPHGRHELLVTDGAGGAVHVTAQVEEAMEFISVAPGRKTVALRVEENELVQNMPNEQSNLFHPKLGGINSSDPNERGAESSHDITIEGEGATIEVKMMGGEPPYLYEWSDAGLTRSNERDDMDAGLHWVQVSDEKQRRAKFVFKIDENLGGERCEELLRCGRLRRLHNKVLLMECLVHASRRVLWYGIATPSLLMTRVPSTYVFTSYSAEEQNNQNTHVQHCDLLSSLSLARQLSSVESAFSHLDALYGGDEGAIYVALLTFKIAYKAFPAFVSRLHPIFLLNEPVFLLFEQWTNGQISGNHFFQQSMCVLYNRCPQPVDVVLYGPYGFNNDPVFAPIFAAHAGHSHKVLSVLPRRYMFLSSLVMQASFPWRLEVHVQLVARFLHQIREDFAPKFVWPSDSGSVLAIGWLEGGSAYPPCPLSKLCPGFVDFSPRHYILSSDDGMRFIYPEFTQHSYNGTRYFFKREYSESSSGVAYVDLADPASLEIAILDKFRRTGGIEMMDITLPVRVFLQQSASQGSVQHIGCRFYSNAGRVVAAFSSVVARSHALPKKVQALSYVTIRHARVEESLKTIIANLNFTGFGAAWFIESQLGLYLIDFNPRFERHTCLAFANKTFPDPCLGFWLGIIPDEPFFYPSGTAYQDPSRFLDYDSIAVEAPEAVWNIESRDEILFKDVTDRIAAAKKKIE